MKSARSGICTVLALGVVVACAPSAAMAAAHIVNPGESIQAAIDGASPGDVIKVMPGDYTETHGNPDAILITKRLKLIGRPTSDGGVRLLPGAGNVNGIVVRGAEGALVDRVMIKGFTVEGFSNHGIWLEYANKFKLKNNVSADNLHNGIFPTLSTNGLVKNNVAYGALDAGLWVEASENVRVIKNEVYNNPTGLELTISKNILVKANDIHDNTVGLGLYHPNGAGLPYPGPDEDWKIVGNKIYDNNFPNPVMGGLVGQLPTGIGTLLIGVDDVTMLKNEITGNGFVGLAVVNWCDFNDCDADPPVDGDPLPRNNTIVRNTITGNGLDPSPDPENPNPFSPLAGDVIAILNAGILQFDDGSTGNCYSGNTIDMMINPSLPAC